MEHTFKTVRKGYNKSDVDEYIVNLCKSYERSLSAQKERIENLKMEIAAKEKLISEYNDKKDSITRSITMAVEKAKQIEYASKVRYALEGERLKIFSDRWTRYCENVINKVDGETVASTKRFINKAASEIKSDLMNDLNLGTYLNEANAIFDSERSRLAGVSSATNN